MTIFMNFFEYFDGNTLIPNDLNNVINQLTGTCASVLKEKSAVLIQ